MFFLPAAVLAAHSGRHVHLETSGQHHVMVQANGAVHDMEPAAVPLELAEIKAEPCTAGETGQHGADASFLHCRPWSCRDGVREYGLQQRARKEIHDVSDAEFHRFRVAFRQLHQREEKTYRDNSTTLWGHGGAPSTAAFVHLHEHSHHGHMHSNFLPFHRRMILEVETQLQVVSQDCSVMLPYWNWAAEKTEFGQSQVWSHERFGNLSAGCVETGVPAGWAYGDCLQRGAKDLWSPNMYGNVLPTWAEARRKIKATKLYSEIRPVFEYWHNSMHCAVHGDMCSLKAPRDPVFYLHHSMIDRAWYYWQQAHAGPETEACGDCKSLESFGNVDAHEYVGKIQDGCIPLPVSQPQVCLSYQTEPQIVLDLDAAGTKKLAEEKEARRRAAGGIRSSLDFDPNDLSKYCICLR
mmetsp:Transcript_2423/g.5512  ORF Transcript_2423/g.5512 Transcript_2423/m.5512 type:complete len:409 (+) Transcript_2423:59-1285(+)